MYDIIDIIDTAYYIYYGDSLKTELKKYVYKNIIRQGLILCFKYSRK
jgi:hypothetical protein